MESNDNYRLSTWGSLWQCMGIENHCKYGYYYVLTQAKMEDVRDWFLYWLFLSKRRPPLFGEPKENFYIRKIYTTSYDCFDRPICGPASSHITIGLREEQPIENMVHLVLKKGQTREAINFGSYNYLGFGGPHPVTTKSNLSTLETTGSFYSGLAGERGVSPEQTKLEGMLAEFLHKEAAVVVPMGFATNSTLIPFLAGKGDVIFSDALNHSSEIYGIKSSRAELKIFKHNDMMDLKKKLELLKKKGMDNGQQPKKILVIVEGLYSMEGEFCPLKELIALKKAYGFYIYIDEAHSIGALGENGRGITEHLGCNFDDVDVLMGTFSKSFASAGGYIASDKKTVDLIRSNCYSYVYGSPMSPVEAQQIATVLTLIQSDEGKKRIKQLRKNSITLRQKFKDAGLHVLGDYDSPVIPVMIYHPAKIKDISRSCLKNGVAIVVVGPPACPIVSCRIRFCISASHTDDDIEKAFNVTMNAMTETSCIYDKTPKPKCIYTAPKTKLEDLLALPKNPREMPPLHQSSENRKTIPIPIQIEGVNLLTFDLHGFEGDVDRRNAIKDTINYYGCGSCGPRGFYGTTLEHLNIEEKLKEFFNTNEAVVYSYGSNTISSVVHVYAKEGNIILVDEYANYTIQLGCRLGKAQVIKFKHNDVDDLKDKVTKALQGLSYQYNVYIITEGVFQHDFSIAPLKEITKLRTNRVFLIVDDSLGIGAIGKHLKGSVEHCGLSFDEVDALCASLEFACHTVGGFVVGKYSFINRQRMMGAGYVFSASAPPFTCTAGKFAFEKFTLKGREMRQELQGKREYFDSYTKKMKNVEVIGDGTLPFVLLNCDGRNDELVKVLAENGFNSAIQRHLEEDWCQNAFVRVNLGKNIKEEEIEKLAGIISEF